MAIHINMGMMQDDELMDQMLILVLVFVFVKKHITKL